MKTNDGVKQLTRLTQEYFAFLLSRGFRVTSCEFHPEHMGYWQITLESNNLIFTIRDDRGLMLYIDHIQDRDAKFIDLAVAVFFVTQGERFIGFYRGPHSIDAQLRWLAEILSPYLDEILRAIGDDYMTNKPDIMLAWRKVSELYERDIDNRLRFSDF